MDVPQSPGDIDPMFEFDAPRNFDFAGVHDRSQDKADEWFNIHFTICCFMLLNQRK